jgi:uncharacterized protein
MILKEREMTQETTTFVYIHGFNSAFNPESDKVKSLEKLGIVMGFTYDSFSSYDEILKSFKLFFNNIEMPEDVVFVGTSLGGFWATECAKAYGTPSVIINPCHTPKILLQKYVGIEHTNFLTGQKNILTQEVVNSYLGKTIHENNSCYFFLPLLLLDMADEVIDSKETLELCHKFPKLTFVGGSHRFDHMEESLHEISRYVNFCSHAEHFLD